MSLYKSIWCHDLNAWVTELDVKFMIVRCPYCGEKNNKYVKSHYTGGMPCVLLTKYCSKCGQALRR